MKKESVLVMQLNQGDMQAFNCIYCEYYKRLCAFAMRYVAPSECEEMVQDVMTWIWEHHAIIAPDTSMKSFLFASVKYKCLNENNHRDIKNNVHEELGARMVESSDASDYYEVQELREMLRRSLYRMPVEYRKAFVMNRFQNATYNEIAEKMGVSPKTIAYRISQSLKILREALKDYLP